MPDCLRVRQIMEIFLIDAIGPFFRGYQRKRVNWSKIPFLHLDSATPELWEAIESDLRIFAKEAVAQGYNAVSLDDLAHLAHHPLHEPELRERIGHLREKFRCFFDLLKHEFGLEIYLTSDVVPVTPAVEEKIGHDKKALDDFYQELVVSLLDDFPQLAGLILRIGESDGNDVKDPIRTRLHVKNPQETNQLLRGLLPVFEARGKNLIFRTWTVGAHPIGDLMWHRDTLDRTLDGLDSKHLIVSMKHGESDFFRYLPLNRAFFRVKQRKLLELQARREYEGAGEYPSFIGWDCEKFASELAGVEGMAGISVWCQTGGWHRFKRRAFLEQNSRDVWIRFNTQVATAVFKKGTTADAALESMVGPERLAATLELLDHADVVIRDLMYIPEFASQKHFFRRVRIPPLLHVYWDSLFINHGVRKVMRHFVSKPEEALRQGEEAARLFPRMIELAAKAELPVDDIEHLRDFLHLAWLARRYYFQPFDETLVEEIREAKKVYKQRWPSEERQRYRIKISFAPFPVKRRTLGWAVRVLIRKQRGYRWLDKIFILRLAGFAYRTLRPRDPAKMPKFLRKSAMGVDVLFK